MKKGNEKKYPYDLFSKIKIDADKISDLMERKSYYLKHSHAFNSDYTDYLLRPECSNIEDLCFGDKCKREINVISAELNLNETPSWTGSLNWKGQKNVLTDVFREMKNRGYLSNPIPEVARFLKANFGCFEDVKQSTIEGMLKNNNSSSNAIPKEEKRIKID